jgi:hypothetical protein
VAKGGYTGGSTVVGPRSGWFTHGKKKPKRKKARPLVRFVGLEGSGEGQRRGLTRKEWLAKVDGKIVGLRSEIEKTREKLRALEAALAKLEEERSDAASETLAIDVSVKGQ